MTRRLKIKIALEWRDKKPTSFVNVYAFVKTLKNGDYKIIANDHNGSIYAGINTFNKKHRCFEQKY